MITNIVASIVVTLVTNTAEFPLCFGNPTAISKGIIYSNENGSFVLDPAKANEKHIVTSIIEKTICSFSIAGKRFDVLISEKEVSRKSVTLRKKEEWVEERSGEIIKP